MGCGYYRMFLPFGEFKRRGNIVSFVEQHEDPALLASTLLIMQRASSTSTSFPTCSASRRPVKKVFDGIDDALIYIPRVSPNFKDLTRAARRWPGSTPTIVKACDGVIASTPDLADESDVTMPTCTCATMLSTVAKLQDWHLSNCPVRLSAKADQSRMGRIKHTY